MGKTKEKVVRSTKKNDKRLSQENRSGEMTSGFMESTAPGTTVSGIDLSLESTCGAGQPGGATKSPRPNKTTKRKTNMKNNNMKMYVTITPTKKKGLSEEKIVRKMSQESQTRNKMSERVKGKSSEKRARGDPERDVRPKGRREIREGDELAPIAEKKADKGEIADVAANIRMRLSKGGHQPTPKKKEKEDNSSDDDELYPTMGGAKVRGTKKSNPDKAKRSERQLQRTSTERVPNRGGENEDKKLSKEERPVIERGDKPKRAMEKDDDMRFEKKTKGKKERRKQKQKAEEPLSADVLVPMWESLTAEDLMQRGKQEEVDVWDIPMCELEKYEKEKMFSKAQTDKNAAITYFQQMCNDQYRVTLKQHINQVAQATSQGKQLEKEKKDKAVSEEENPSAIKFEPAASRWTFSVRQPEKRTEDTFNYEDYPMLKDQNSSQLTEYDKLKAQKKKYE